MKISSLIRPISALAFVTPAFATVLVNSPSNGTMVAPNVSFVGSATTSTCSRGVAAMGVYVDNRLQYVVDGDSINQKLTLAPGSHYVVVQSWDYCGGADKNGLELKVSGEAGVSITAPLNGAKVPNQTLFAATATTSCAGGVSAMGVYLAGNLLYKVAGPTLSAQLTLPTGLQTASVMEWDACGSSASSPVTVSVASTTGPTNPVLPPPIPGGAVKLSALQGVAGWNQWGEYPPNYGICSAPCQGISWQMLEHQTDISLSGNSTKFVLGGTAPYADALWSNKLIGVASTLGQFDRNRTILPNVHNMTFDADIYPTNLAATQDIELDVNLYMNGVGMEWGTECNHLNGGVWDYWDNLHKHWIHSSIPCILNENAWNHVNFTTQRLSDNSLVYKTITVNGVTSNFNVTVPPFPVPGDWYGMTVNYQLDGNKNMTTNVTYLDNLSVTYW